MIEKKIISVFIIVFVLNSLWVMNSSGQYEKDESSHPDNRMVQRSGGIRDIEQYKSEDLNILDLRQDKSLGFGEAWCVAYSHNGERIAIGDHDGVINIINTSSRKVERQLFSLSEILSICWSPDDSMVAGGGGDYPFIDYNVRIWNISTGKCIKVLNVMIGKVRHLAWSPNGSYLACGASFDYQPGKIMIWDINKGLCMKIIYDGDPYNVFWLSDGTRLFYQNNTGVVVILDTSNWNMIDALSVDGSYDCKPSPNGTWILGQFSKFTRIYDIESKKLVRNITTNGMQPIWSQDGSEIAIRYGNMGIMVWDIIHSIPRMTINADVHFYTSAFDWSPNGTAIAVASSLEYVVEIWSTIDGKCLAVIGYFDGIWLEDLSPDKTKMLCLSGSNSSINKVLRILDAQSCESLAYALINETSGLVARWSLDGDKIALLNISGAISLFDSDTLQLKSIIKAQHTSGMTSSGSLSWSRDGSLLAWSPGTCATSNTIEIWNASTGSLLLNLSGHTDHIQELSFSPVDDTLASCGGDNIVRLWNISDGSCRIFLGHNNIVTSISWSPDGSKVASGDIDGNLNVWNVSSGSLIATFPSLPSICSLRWSPSGSFIAFSGESSFYGGGCIGFIDVSAMIHVNTIYVPTNFVTRVEWMKDSLRLVTMDTIIRIWTDNVPPCVTSTSPGTNETNVKLDTKLNITFRESVNRSSAEKSISISPVVDVSSVVWDSLTMTVSFNNNLNYGVQYTVSLKAEMVFDACNNTLDGNGDGISDGSPTDDYIWHFTAIETSLNIQHTPVTTGEVYEPTSINATVIDNVQISTVMLYCKNTTGVNFNGVPMVNRTDNLFAAKIPTQTEPTTLYYYIWANDTTGNEKQSPASGNYSISIKDVSTPSINHEPIIWMKVYESETIFANATDDVGVSKVTLNYKGVADYSWKSSSMTRMSGNEKNGTWNGILPAQTNTGKLHYYIEASDGFNNITAPASISNPYEVLIKDITSPSVEHTPIVSAMIGDSIPIVLIAEDDVIVANVLLYYKNVDDADFRTINMTLSSGNSQNGTWIADISPQIKEGTVYYYIKASDGYNNLTTEVYSTKIVKVGNNGTDGVHPPNNKSSDDRMYVVLSFTTSVIFLAIAIYAIILGLWEEKRRKEKKKKEKTMKSKVRKKPKRSTQ